MSAYSEFVIMVLVIFLVWALLAQNGNSLEQCPMHVKVRADNIFIYGIEKQCVLVDLCKYVRQNIIIGSGYGNIIIELQSPNIYQIPSSLC